MRSICCAINAAAAAAATVVVTAAAAVHTHRKLRPIFDFYEDAKMNVFHPCRRSQNKKEKK